jgi:hypothetical protein
MGRLVHTGLGSSSLVAHVLHYPPPHHAKSFLLGPAVIKHTHTAVPCLIPRLVWTSLTLNRWYNSLSPTETLRKVLEDGRQDGLRDTLLRGPKAVVQKTESRHAATFGLLLGLLGFRCECGRCAWRLPTDEGLPG